MNRTSLLRDAALVAPRCLLCNGLPSSHYSHYTNGRTFMAQYCACGHSWVREGMTGHEVRGRAWANRVTAFRRGVARAAA